MYNAYARELHNEIDNTSLVYCTKIAQKIKEPPYIPFLEVFTYGLVAKYFELSENRIKNAYNTNRYIFEDDCTMISGKDLALYAEEQKPLGKHYGYLCGYPNGVMATIAYSSNLVFNTRGLLHFAVLLEDESEIAAEITNMMSHGDQYKHKYLPRKTHWFFAEQKEPMHEVSMCPFIAQMKNEAVARDGEPPVKFEAKVGGGAKKCARVDKLGRVIKVFDSIADAGRYYGIKPYCVSNCLNGRSKTTGNEKLMFKYVD